MKNTLARATGLAVLATFATTAAWAQGMMMNGGMMHGGMMGQNMHGGMMSSAATANAPSAAPGTLALNATQTPTANTIMVSVMAHALPGPDGKKHDAFMPSNFVVKEGQKVTFKIANYDEMPHSITAPGLNVNIAIPAAGTAANGKVTPSVTTYSFTPAHKGMVRWYCVTPCDGKAGGWAMAPGFDGMGRDGYMAGYFAVI